MSSSGIHAFVSTRITRPPCPDPQAELEFRLATDEPYYSNLEVAWWPRQDNGLMRLPVMPPVSPMLAKSVPSIPPDASYEPEWDGFRSICFRDDFDVELGSRNERPMTRYFP